MTEPKVPAGIQLDVSLDSIMQEALASVEKRTAAAKTAKAPAPAVEEAALEDPPDTGPGDVPLEVEPAVAAGAEVAVEVEAPPVPAAPPPKRTPQDAVIEALVKAKQEATDALKQTQKEAKDLMEARVRVQAEFENYKKRVGREKQDAQLQTTKNLMRDLLGVADNFERAMQTVQDATLPAEAKTLVTGVRMVGKQMQEAFKKIGVTSFDSKGAPFDPVRHEAVSQVPAEGDVTPGTVVEEHQKGYLLGDQLLRPALVVVAGPKE
jgi:molecular chaperone GrpE